MEFNEYLEMLKSGNIEQRAAAIALEYGHIDGAHHKQWVIDQMLRLISGSAYKTLMAYCDSAGYEWDTGIAP